MYENKRHIHSAIVCVNVLDILIVTKNLYKCLKSMRKRIILLICENSNFCSCTVVNLFTLLPLFLQCTIYSLPPCSLILFSSVSGLRQSYRLQGLDLLYSRGTSDLTDKPPDSLNTSSILICREPAFCLFLSYMATWSTCKYINLSQLVITPRTKPINMSFLFLYTGHWFKLPFVVVWIS